MRSIIFSMMFVSISAWGLSLKEIEADVFSSKKLDKIQVMKKLNDAANEDKELTFYLLGIVHGYGLYGNEVNLEKAEKYLLGLVKLDYKDANYFLGTLLSRSSDPQKIREASVYLINSSAKGDLDALYNLYSLYSDGFYTDKSTLSNLLKSNLYRGDKEIVIQFGKVMLDIYLEKPDKEKMLSVLSSIENIDLTGFEGQYYYLLSGYYGFPTSPLFDESKSINYLYKSHKHGYAAATKLLVGMGLLEQK